jgi:hypothetical protein
MGSKCRMHAMGSMQRRMQLTVSRTQAWRPTGTRARGLIRSLATSYVAVDIVLFVQPGRSVSGALEVAAVFGAVTVAGLLLRPLLVGLAVFTNSFGLLIAGILSQAITLTVATVLDSIVGVKGHPPVLLAVGLAAVATGFVGWILDISNEDIFLDQLLGRAIRVARRRRRTHDDATESTRPRLVVIQFDGVGEDVLREAIAAGSMPTLAGWLQTGSHTLRGWHTGLPATTPAGQAVLLHGNVTEVPAFRWYEKESGRILVANHPRDAAEIERRISTGDGLLASGGVSVSNLFSGDAPIRLLTMSNARLPPLGARRFAFFASTPSGLVRSFIMFVEQATTELYQGYRQRRRKMLPRVRRGAVFALQRALTTAFLREPTIGLVTEQIARGAPVIYADFVSYDEVAHHAGPSRSDSMRTLHDLDRVVGYIENVVRETGGDYEVAVVSDHGQSQGATFAQLSGHPIHDVIAMLADEIGKQAALSEPARVSADSAPAERWGPANLLLTGVARSDGVAARAMTRNRVGEGRESEVTVGSPRTTPPATPTHEAALVVTASGSLAHVYLRDVPGRASREQIDARYPRMVEGLAHHPGIGAVMVRSASRNALVVLGPAGWRILTPGGAVDGEGDDPVAIFGAHAAADLLALDGRRHVGDLVLLGRLDPATGEVAAFEELVGSHGGLGGGQTEAVLLHPVAWSAPEGGMLRGSDVHELLREHVPTRIRVARQ